MLKPLCYAFIGMLFLAVAGFWAGQASAQPITSDSRIKTFVYNPNEVFTITTHYGYQSNVEFGHKETIDTISVGDRVAWQVIPAGGRLFIRAMEENARTNMTVVTNKRAYQFDLRSSSANAVFGSEELTYVVRFFYPGDPDNKTAVYVPPMAASAPVSQPYVRDLAPPVTSTPAPITLTRPVSPVPATAVPAPMPVAAAETGMMNYRYTFSGPKTIAPTKIFDDGKTTYFKLPGNAAPKFSIMTARGEAVDVPSRRTNDGLVAVDAVAPRFRLNQTGQEVIVYNEAGEEVR